MARVNLSEFKKKALKNENVKEEYEKLAPEFEIKKMLISKRLEAGLTQEELAERMGTKKSNISRLESLNNHRLPSLDTLTLIRYAEAIGGKLELEIKA